MAEPDNEAADAAPAVTQEVPPGRGAAEQADQGDEAEAGEVVSLTVPLSGGAGLADLGAFHAQIGDVEVVSRPDARVELSEVARGITRVAVANAGSGSQVEVRVTLRADG